MNKLMWRMIKGPNWEVFVILTSSSLVLHLSCKSFGCFYAFDEEKHSILNNSVLILLYGVKT